MGVQERRSRDKEVLRQQILDAARQMFVEEGYESVSMRKIADRIEYSPTTIYLHFKDKAEIFHQLCEETFGKLAHHLETLRRRHDDPVDYLREGLRAYVDFGLKNPNHYTVAFILKPNAAEDDYAFEDSLGARAFATLQSGVAACVEAGVLRPVDVDTTAQSLWAGIHGVTSLLIVHCDFPFVSKNKLIDHTIDMMIRGLLP